MNGSEREEPSRPGGAGDARRPGSRALAVGAGIALVVLALTAAVYVLLVVVPAKTVETGEAAGRGAVRVAQEGARTAMELGSELAARLKDELGLRPRVVVDSRVVAEQSKEILELATVERQYRVEYTFAHTWLGSTKEIRLEGSYRAKAGFDLEKGFLLGLETRDEGAREETGPESSAGAPPGVPFRIEVRLPRPELLSLELRDVEVKEEEGIWNRISDADRQRALRNLRGTARRDILRTSLLDEARESMAGRVRKAFLDHFAPTELEFGELSVPEVPEASSE